MRNFAPGQLEMFLDSADRDAHAGSDFFGGKAPHHLRDGHLVRIHPDEQALLLRPVVHLALADEPVVLVETVRRDPAVLGLFLLELVLIESLQQLQEPFPFLVETEDGQGNDQQGVNSILWRSAGVCCDDWIRFPGGNRFVQTIHL